MANGFIDLSFVSVHSEATKTCVTFYVACVHCTFTQFISKRLYNFVNGRFLLSWSHIKNGD